MHTQALLVHSNDIKQLTNPETSARCMHTDNRVCDVLEVAASNVLDLSYNDMLKVDRGRVKR